MLIKTETIQTANTVRRATVGALAGIQVSSSTMGQASIWRLAMHWLSNRTRALRQSTLAGKVKSVTTTKIRGLMETQMEQTVVAKAV